MEHQFMGKWITDSEFADLAPRNVFHRQLEPLELPCDQHRNRHILFRRTFTLDDPTAAVLYISADDYYKVYINGSFVAQGPAPAYHRSYPYNAVDVETYLKQGENVIAVHTLYQGLINRVWQSGDQRHGLILDLVAGGKTVLASDESFLTHPHTAYRETGICGYDTQFLESYDSAAPEVGFAAPDFDDSQWQRAKINLHADHTLTAQKSKMLEFETVLPVTVSRGENSVTVDFGATYVGYLCAAARGQKGDAVTVRCAQERNVDGSLRYELRANCTYEETWLLAQGESTLDWFDYKSFRYAEFIFPQGVEIRDISLCARHYPFRLEARMKPEYAENEDLRKIWELCLRTQKYGVQEVIQDCMEREKGFYLGDGCYTALTNMLLTRDDSMVRKLIDDAFAGSFITDTLVTCMNCSLIQEIAEYPLILVFLVLWHYRLTGDRGYLAQNYEKVRALLDAYRREYEDKGLLRNVDKWCVVEWPKNFRHGYDVDIREWQVCTQAHVSLNAYYIGAVKTANTMARILEKPKYREETPLIQAFMAAFYDEKEQLFKDGENTCHISLVGNSFVYAFGICPQEAFRESFVRLYEKHGIRSLSMFCTFPVLMGFVKNRRQDLVTEALLDEGAWKRILREGGTTTFEGWGKDTKWNTSLFHLTMSYAAVFLADTNLNRLFDDGWENESGRESL